MLEACFYVWVACCVISFDDYSHAVCGKDKHISCRSEVETCESFSICSSVVQCLWAWTFFKISLNVDICNIFSHVQCKLLKVN